MNLVLPVDTIFAEWVPMARPVGVLGGPPDQENLGGYPVETEKAVRALKEKSPEAATWWEELPTIGLMNHLVFGRKFCELVP